MSNIKYVKDHSTQEIIYPVVKAGGIIDAWDIMDEDIYNLFYPRVESILITTKNVSLKPLQQKELKYNITPSDAYNQKISWATENEQVAVVDSKTNSVISHLPGITTVTITSKDGNHSNSIEVEVELPTNKQILYQGSDLSTQLEFDSYTTPVYHKGYGLMNYSQDVTYIPNNIFDRSSAKIVYLPDTIEAIGDMALNKINQINIPKSLTYVGDDSLCELEITKLELPKTLENVGEYSFCDGNLSDLFIYENLTHIGVGAFTGHPYEKIVVDKNHKIYDSRDNCNALIETETNTLKVGSANTIIPEDIIKIDERAFYKNTKLENITIPTSIEIIEDNAFTDCTNLSAYHVSSRNSNYSSIDGVLYDKNKTILFDIPSKVKQIIIPDTCTTVNCPIENKENLTVFDTGDGLTSFQEGIFKNCPNLKEITIGENLSGSTNDLFENVIPETVNLNSLNLQYENDIIGVKTLNIGKNVSNIPTNLKNLSNITVHSDNLTYDSRNNCNAVIETDSDKLILGSQNTVIPNDIKTIGQSAFEDSAVKDIVIPESVTLIEESAFKNSGLEFVEIPDGVELGPSAFENNANLKSVKLPSDLTVIQDGLFMNSAILDIYIPSTVTQIGIESFRNTSIEELIIPDSVREIGGCSFQETPLKTINIGKNVASIENKAFYCDTLNSITWNAVNCEDSFSTSEGTHQFGSCSNLEHITFSEGVKRIPDYMLLSSNLITELELPKSLEYCGEKCFIGCNKLEKLTVNSINLQECKHGSTNISQLLFAEGVTRIPSYIAENCTNLTDAVIPISATSIGENAFYGCTNIDIVFLHENITSIESNAFANSGIKMMVVSATTPPTIGSNSLNDSIKEIIVPTESIELYKSTWVDYADKISDGYLPTECTSLTITALDVNAEDTTTTISYTAQTNGENFWQDVVKEGIEITGTEESKPFEPNLSEDSVVTRTIEFNYLGQTAVTTITQGRYTPKKVRVILNDQWKESEVELPKLPESNQLTDITALYESNTSNEDYSTAVMYIDFENCSELVVGFRSDSEGDYDYVIVSQPNVNITEDVDLTDTSLVAGHTKGKSNSGTSLTSYQGVSFSDLSMDKQRITVLYTKDSTKSEGTDKGYVFINY